MRKAIEKMTIEELETAINQAENIILDGQSFGLNDVQWRSLLYTEIEKRKLCVNYQSKITLERGDEQ